MLMVTSFLDRLFDRHPEHLLKYALLLQSRTTFIMFIRLFAQKSKTTLIVSDAKFDIEVAARV